MTEESDELEKSKAEKIPITPNQNKKIFSAPPGVKRYNVRWSNLRRYSGSQKLIFVWPQEKRIRPNYFTYSVPVIRGALNVLVFLGSVHLWPGEFLPTMIPPTAPLRKPPVKCNVIEPLWDDAEFLRKF